MTDVPAIPIGGDEADDEISVFAIATVLLRYRRMILVLAALGLGTALGRGLLSPRNYRATATFIPQGAAGTTSGLALAASQLGLSMPSPGGAWSPQMYVELVRYRSVLLPIVLDTITVVEEGGRRTTLVELLKVSGSTSERRISAAVQALRGMIEATEDRKLGGVKLSVVSGWPSVSLAISQRLVQRVDRFNIETRRSQAQAERQFVAGQVAESEAALQDAESRLQSFLQRNREIGGAPNLLFERDRLQREVTRRNQLYTAWLQSGEEARIREIRDTPVITVIEEPQLPFVGEPRKSIQKGIVGGFAGLTLGALLALIFQGYQMARRSPSEEARTFFRAMDAARPAFLRRRMR